MPSTVTVRTKSSIRSHVYLLSLAILPPAWLLWRLFISHSPPSVSFATSAALLYALVLHRIVIRHYTSPLRHIPVPDGDWFALGHGIALYADKPRGSSVLRWAQQLPSNTGFIRLIDFLHLQQTVYLTSPESIADMLTKHPYDFAKPHARREFLRALVGDGLVAVDGKEHKFQRKTVSPSFQMHHIKNLVPLFWSKAVEFTDVIAKEKDKPASAGVVEMVPFASRLTLDIIGVAVFGRDFGTLYNPDDQLASYYIALLNPADKRIVINMITRWIIPGWIHRRLPFLANEIVVDGSARARATNLKLLDEKRSGLDTKSVDEPSALIEVLLRTADVSDDFIVAQLTTFMAAGHETTTSAIQWLLYTLASNQEMQQRVRNELSAALSLDSQVDADLIDGLGYLNAICMESLRFRPTVPQTERVAVCDTTIAGQAIPKGTHLIVAPWVINHLESLWGSDAEKFVEERWMSKANRANGGAASPYSFSTFIHGPRSCIGQNFAKLELKCMLAALVLRFQFEMADPDEVVVPCGVITIKPENGLHLRFKDLKSQAS